MSVEPDPPRGESPFKSTAGLARIGLAFRYSLSGLRAAWIAEHAFRQELALAAVLVPGALVLPASLTQKALLVFSVALVLVVELINSAIESTVDRISLERHELSGRAKDVGSAAVLVALCNVAIVWVLVLLDVLVGG